MNKPMHTLTLTPLGKQRRVVLVACRDSKVQVENLMRYRGYDPQDFLVISRKDNPTLRTIDDIITALPQSVQLVALDDVEHLLPEGERTPASVQALLEAASIRYAHRGLTFVATMTDESLNGLTWEVGRRRP